ncbi:hypothetical protein V8F20_002079 [Naviculisporaceae sp. PSN 640]
MACRLFVPRVPTSFLPRRAAASLVAPSFANTSFSSVSTRSTIRTMSSSEAAPRKFEWLVVIPDFPGVQEKRIAVRPLHFAGLKPMLQSGTFQMGGAILNEVPKDDQPSSLDFAGSTVIAVAESREEILEILKNDVYVKEGVWDLSKVQMWPLKCAFRIPVPGQMS